jgi:hypothetical protein
VLILAYNRHDQVKGLIESLRVHAPQKIRVAVDGPKNSQSDRTKVSEVIRELEAIDWTTDVKHLIRNSNLGIRFAVPEAVSWAIQETGQVIVIEDDVRVGEDFFYFMEYALAAFKDDPMIGHVSGYNPVPQLHISKPNDICRATIYPESYAWATWANKWQYYSDEIPRLAIADLEKLAGSFWSAIEWKIHFHNARKDNVSTWAYRWVAALWKNNLISVTPNANITKYLGSESGTHTRTQPKWSEPPLSSLRAKTMGFKVDRDLLADKWIARTVFMGHPKGILVRAIQSLALTGIGFLSSKKVRACREL